MRATGAMTGGALSPSRGRARIGIVTPFSNTHLEADLALLRPWGVSCHIVRASGYDLDAVPDGEQMRRFARTSLDSVLKTLMAARPDVVLYGCTSATMAMGPDYDRAFRARIEDIAGVPAVTAAGALVMFYKTLEMTAAVNRSQASTVAKEIRAEIARRTRELHQELGDSDPPLRLQFEEESR